MDSLPPDADSVEPIEGLCRFRWDFYSCLRARADVLFELTDAVGCSDGPVRTLAELSVEPEHRRGHGGRYDGINAGRIEFARLRRTLAGLPLPRVGERIVLAVDVSPWLRPDAETSPDRLFCYVHGRARGPLAEDPRLAVFDRRCPADWPDQVGPPCWTRSASDRPTTSPR